MRPGTQSSTQNQPGNSPTRPLVTKAIPRQVTESDSQGAPQVLARSLGANLGRALWTALELNPVRAGMVETAEQLGNRKTWRITGYPQDPTESKQFHLELTFDEKEVTFRKTTGQDTVTEKISLPTADSQSG